MLSVWHLDVSQWTAKMGSARGDDLHQMTTYGNSVLPFHSTFSLMFNFSRNLQPWWCCITSSHPDQSFSYGCMLEKSDCIQLVWSRGNAEQALQLVPASGCGTHPDMSFHNTTALLITSSHVQRQNEPRSPLVFAQADIEISSCVCSHSFKVDIIIFHGMFNRGFLV